MTPELAVIVRAVIVAAVVLGLEALSKARRRAKAHPRGRTPVLVHHVYSDKARIKASVRRGPARA